MSLNSLSKGTLARVFLLLVEMKSHAVCCHESWTPDGSAMRMLFFAGAVCLHPRCHLGGMSLWRHNHPRQSAPLRVLRHEPPGPADQLQPH